MCCELVLQFFGSVGPLEGFGGLVVAGNEVLDGLLPRDAQRGHNKEQKKLAFPQRKGVQMFLTQRHTEQSETILTPAPFLVYINRVRYGTVPLEGEKVAHP